MSSLKIDENTSDGFHTFKELYHYRMLYNAAAFNEWQYYFDEYGINLKMPKHIHKSYRHSDNELCFGGGWFVVSAQLPTGQITNHYRSEYWDLFQIEERDKAAEWDGHTPQQAAERLEAFLRQTA